MTSTLIDRQVIRVDDDSDCPTTGVIVGLSGDEFAWVVWGEAQYNITRRRNRVDARREALDELAPYRRRR